MIYLEKFDFPSRDDEEAFFNTLIYLPRTVNTKYPFNVFRYSELPTFEFEPVTIFYGANGSGKSTILNVISEQLGIQHQTPYNKSLFFEDYVQLCESTLNLKCLGRIPRKSRIITSDDVFDKLIETRHINERIDRDREILSEENHEIRRRQLFGDVYQLKSLDDYENLEKVYAVSKGKFMDRSAPNIIEKSNGENALKFFETLIDDNALYLLDEPENSLAAEKQLEICDYIANAARFYGCQFIISTHSPFFLAIPHAKIYNIDTVPPTVSKWTQLPNVRAYFDLFERYRDQFGERI